MSNVSFALFLLLCFLLPFPWHFAQPVAVAWIVAWALECRWVQPKNFSFTKNQIPLLLLIGFVVWEIVSLLWTNQVEVGKHEIEKHLPIFGILLVGLFGTNKTYKPFLIKKAIYIGGLVSIVAYTILIYWCKENYVIPIFRDYYVYDIWAIFGEGPVGLIKHRLYYCLVLMLALCFSGDLYRHYKAQYSPQSVFLTLAIGDMLLITVIVLTGSRTMMALLPVIAIITIIFNTKKWMRWSMIALLLVCIIVGGMWMMEHNSRFLKTEEDVTNVSMEQLLTHPFEKEPRIYIWYTIFTHREAYTLKGLGVGSANQFLLERYQEDGIPEVIEKAYGPHCSYLHTWMELGPLAAVYLLLILCLSPLCHKGMVRKDAIWLCLIFGWGMLTETLHTRMIGLYILLSMLVLIQIEARDTDSEQPVRP